MKHKIITSIFGWNERERKSEAERINEEKNDEKEKNHITNSKRKWYAILSAFMLRIFSFCF